MRNQYEVAGEITMFYRDVFTDEMENHPMIDGLEWSPISQVIRGWRDLLMKRKLGVEMDEGKSLGPDGFRAAF